MKNELQNQLADAAAAFANARDEAIDAIYKDLSKADEVRIQAHVTYTDARSIAEAIDKAIVKALYKARIKSLDKALDKALYEALYETRAKAQSNTTGE